jgi:hypothetical protein
MPKDIEFSLHSLLKIEILKSHGIDISKSGGGSKAGGQVFNLDVSLVNNSIRRKASSRKEKNGFKIIP